MGTQIPSQDPASHFLAGDRGGMKPSAWTERWSRFLQGLLGSARLYVQTRERRPGPPGREGE